MNDVSCVGGDDSVSLSASASSFLISHLVSSSLPTPLSVYSPREAFLIYYICMYEQKTNCLWIYIQNILPILSRGFSPVQSFGILSIHFLCVLYLQSLHWRPCLNIPFSNFLQYPHTVGRVYVCTTNVCGIFIRVASSRSTQTGRPPNIGEEDCFGAIILGIAYKTVYILFRHTKNFANKKE